MQQSNALSTFSLGSQRPLLDANDLMLFAKVAELGSFSRAAEQAGLPKSTVSRRLTALEKRLGERLLLRTTRRQSVTEFGLQVLEHARQVAAQVEAAAALSEHRQLEPSGTLRVSMPGDLALLTLVPPLAAFCALHPAIQLDLDLSPRRVDLLGEGFDVALRLGDLPDDSLLAARRLNVFTRGLYAAPAYTAERGMPQLPDDLARFDALCLRGANGKAQSWSLTQGAERWDGIPAGRVSANSPELLIGMARAGAGIAAVPDFIAAPHVRRGELVKVLPAWSLPSDICWAVFPGGRLMPAKTRVFIDMLRVALA